MIAGCSTAGEAELDHRMPDDRQHEQQDSASSHATICSRVKLEKSMPAATLDARHHHGRQVPAEHRTQSRLP